MISVLGLAARPSHRDSAPAVMIEFSRLTACADLDWIGRSHCGVCRSGPPRPAGRSAFRGYSLAAKRGIFSARHLEAVIKEFLAHYHQARPHQGLDQPCPDPVPAFVPLRGGGKIVRHDRLGGLLHECYRAA